jgi:hypothetical protein
MSEWTRIPPSAPGFWWIRDGSGGLQVAHAVGSDDDLRLGLPGLDGEHAPDASVFRDAAWWGPLALPSEWTAGLPATPGWYWIRTPPSDATVVLLFRPWEDDDALWAAGMGRREAPLRRAGLSLSLWAGPLVPPASLDG